MQELLTFQKFATAEDAGEVADELEQEGIPTEVVKNTGQLDAVFIGGGYADKYELKIAGADFIRAKKILFRDAQIDINDLDPGHPLFAMSTDELRDIVAKPDEWGPENYNIALALLKSKGIPISERFLTQMQEAQMNVVSEKKSFNPYLILFGYATSIAPFILILLRDTNNPAQRYTWYFPGLLGLIVGLVIIQSKTSLPDRERVATYDSATIKQGIIISVLNILSWVVNIILFLFLFA